MSFAAYYTSKGQFHDNVPVYVLTVWRKHLLTHFLTRTQSHLNMRLKKDAVVADKKSHLAEKSFFNHLIYKVKVNCTPIAFLKF